ncbi:MAG: hypothetical protein ACREO4_06305 [Lysobacter sp.]
MQDNDQWTAIQARIAELRLSAEQWKAEDPDPAQFMPEFSGAADCIIDDAAELSDDALGSAHMLIDEILIELGYMDASERQT